MSDTCELSGTRRGTADKHPYNIIEMQQNMANTHHGSFSLIVHMSLVYFLFISSFRQAIGADPPICSNSGFWQFQFSWGIQFSSIVVCVREIGHVVLWKVSGGPGGLVTAPYFFVRLYTHFLTCLPQAFPSPCPPKQTFDQQVGHVTRHGTEQRFIAQ